MVFIFGAGYGAMPFVVYTANDFKVIRAYMRVGSGADPVDISIIRYRAVPEVFRAALDVRGEKYCENALESGR